MSVESFVIDPPTPPPQTPPTGPSPVPPSLPSFYPSLEVRRYLFNETLIQHKLTEFKPRCTAVGRVAHYQHRQNHGLSRQILSNVELGELHGLITNEDPENTKQIIVAEDMSADIYYFLQQSIWAHPNFFHLHLSGSGYMCQPSPTKEDKTARRIGDAQGLSRSFASIRWFRPVDRRRIAPKSQETRDQLLQRSYFLEPVPGDSMDNIVTNIFRNEIPLTAKEEDRLDYSLDYDSDDSDDSILSIWDITSSAAWEERVSIHFSQKPEKNKITTILVDPLPVVRTTRNRETPENPSAQPYEIDHQLFHGPMRENPIIFGHSAMFEGSESATKLLETLDNQDARGTFSDIRDFVDKSLQFNLEFDIVSGIVIMIYNDTVGFLNSVDTLLRDIRALSAQDHILQSHLNFWRDTLDRILIELEGVRTEHRVFAKFLAHHGQPRSTVQLLENSTELIGEIMQSTEKTYSYMRADVGLLENKRGIAQAESVGKLTELGFIFIPITCVTGLFSMQVTELQDTVPLSTAVIAAILSVVIVYMVRLLSRSTLLWSWKRRFVDHVRAHRNMPATAPLPTRSVLRYLISSDFALSILRKVDGVLLFICTSVFLGMIPVLMIWTRPKIDTGFKVVITVIGLISVIATTLILLSRVSKTWRKNVRDRMVIRTINGRKFIQRKPMVTEDSESSAASTGHESSSIGS